MAQRPFFYLISSSNGGSCDVKLRRAPSYRPSRSPRSRASLPARAGPLAREVLMRRREVLTLLTGAAALRPSTARLQPTRKLPGVGYLGAPSPSLYAGQVAALLSGLRELRYLDGTAIHLEFRSAEAKVRSPFTARGRVRAPPSGCPRDSWDTGNTCGEGRIEDHSHSRSSNGNPPSAGIVSLASRTQAGTSPASRTSVQN